MRRALVAAVLLSAFVVLGCGGGDENDATAGATSASGLTKGEYVKEGDAICKDGSDEINAGSRAFKVKRGIAPSDSLSKPQQEELVAVVVVPSVQKQAERLADLAPPPGDKAEVEAVVAGLGKVAKAGKQNPASLLVSAGPVDEVNEAAKKYGILECTQP